MRYLTASRGISGNDQISQFLKVDKIHRLRSFFKEAALNPADVLLGWGFKKNTQKTRKRALQEGVPYWALEDGFISWLNHPTQDKQRLSLIVDKQGIYYDCSAPSGIDYLLRDTNSVSLERAQCLLMQVNQLNISKYNQARCESPDWFTGLFNEQSEQSYILLVDQTFGDCSIACAAASEDDFKRMLQWAKNEIVRDDNAHIIIKTHPDVLLGNKKGYLTKQLEACDSRIHFLGEDVCPSRLINGANQVATVSSQLGFEALWKNKPVTCFGWPFYAGRGLTQDLAANKLPYDRPAASLLQLINTALIQYPTYMHPDSKQPCEVEDIIDFLQAHFISRALQCEKLLVHDVSLWKRSFIPEFIANSAGKLNYTSGAAGKSLVEADNCAGKHLLWGMKSPDLSQRKDIWRMEDGFIRSVGLGADLRRPTSLIVDDLGIYYNGKRASRLEVILNDCLLNDYEYQRTQKLLTVIQQNAITKYNVESTNGDDLACLQKNAQGRDIILVTGQYQQDLSMQYGTLDIKTNMALLQKVSQQYPSAFIIYKEHPDVYSGVRPGKLDVATVLQYANEYVTNINITNLFTISDRVCTICSLSGFEALMRGIKVSTYGLPFYAGWGLTDDYHSISRRKRTLSLLELVYASLVLYPRYVNWSTRTLTTPESVIQQLSIERKHAIVLKSSWLSRQNRKVRYLVQSLFSGIWGRS